MEQWRHTGSVAGAPPADSESDEGCEPERGTYLVISQRVKVPARARATGASSEQQGSGGSTYWHRHRQRGRVKTVARKCRGRGRSLCREGGS